MDDNSIFPNSNSIEGYADGEQPLHFYHQKGEFRKYYDNDKMNLKDLAEGKNKPKKGLFRVLLSTKSNRAIFTGMMMCIALVLALSFLTGSANEGSIDGMYCELTAFSFQEQLFTSLEVRPSYLTKKRHSGDYAQKSFIVSFSVVNSDGVMSESESHDFLYNSKKGESCFARATFGDYEADSVSCEISIGDEKISLTSSVQRK